MVMQQKGAFMNQANYYLERGKLVIKEPSLGIFIEQEFHPKIIDKTFSDCEVEKDEKGQIKKAFFLLDGELEGQVHLFYPDQSLQGEMYYKKGRLHGPSKYYSRDGILLSISWFFEGKKEGISYRYYVNGAIFSEEKYVSGELQGVQKYFYEDGQLQSEASYEDGKPHGVAYLYWPNGELKRIIHFQNGLKHGQEKIWDEEGNLTDNDYYHLGERIIKISDTKDSLTEPINA